MFDDLNSFIRNDLVLWQVLGDVEGFEKAVRLVVEDVTFDTDVVVSVFETNIRVLGWVVTALSCFLTSYLVSLSLLTCHALAVNL